MGEKKINWKNLTEYEKKKARRKYMREYYQRKKSMIRENGRYVSRKKSTSGKFTRTYGEFIVKFN
tara:strand:+ start:3447 stop:3641 length:195 start_codon:yes stop_codon:yes gene_type:complete